MLTMTPTADTSLRRCTDCGPVWLAGAPSAGRLPWTCPNDSSAAVLDAKTLAEVVE